MEQIIKGKTICVKGQEERPRVENFTLRDGTPLGFEEVLTLAGHEQAGKRPAIVLSPLEYNKKTGLMIACPITSKMKGYSFEVTVHAQQIEGVVLSDHVKNLDWKQRKVSFIEETSPGILEQVYEKLLLLVG